MTRECHVRFCERLRRKVLRPTHHFGMKVHTGVDADSGVVHTVAATAANVHDAEVLPQLLHGMESEIVIAPPSTTEMKCPAEKPPG
jgi:transposase, IS5 family